MRRKGWTKQDLLRAVENSRSIRQVLKKLSLRPAGGNYAQVTKYFKLYQISTKHFKGRGWSRGLHGIGVPRTTLKEILISGSSYQSFKLKKRLFAAKLKEPHCERCGWSERSLDGRIPLELDHINGDSSDNRIENLRILCPNCHSLQPTHRGLNRGKYKGEWRNWYTRDT